MTYKLGPNILAIKVSQQMSDVGYVPVDLVRRQGYMSKINVGYFCFTLVKNQTQGESC